MTGLLDRKKGIMFSKEFKEELTLKLVHGG
jgi:hypothetical protein